MSRVNPSKAVQETDVGEGLAVGCLALGVVGVTTEKMAVEFAFRKAWRSWEHAGRFPVVHVGPDRDDILRIIHSSAGRQRSYVAAWTDLPAREYEPYLRGSDWTVEEAGEHLAEHTGVPLEGWRDLAGVFVDDLGEDRVRRV